jgi:hypothetical protein
VQVCLPAVSKAEAKVMILSPNESSVVAHRPRFDHDIVIFTVVDMAVSYKNKSTGFDSEYETVLDGLLRTGGIVVL